MRVLESEFISVSKNGYYYLSFMDIIRFGSLGRLHPNDDDNSYFRDFAEVFIIF